MLQHEATNQSVRRTDAVRRPLAADLKSAIDFDGHLRPQKLRSAIRPPEHIIAPLPLPDALLLLQLAFIVHMGTEKRLP